MRVWYDPNSIENCWVRNGTEFQPMNIVPHQARKYSGYRMEEVQDIIGATHQVSPDSKYQAKNDAAKLKGLQENILAKAKAKKSQAGVPKSKADFKKNKKEKRNSEVQIERDTHTAELNQLRVLEGGPPRQADDDSVLNLPGSVRGAAFLKLVVSEAKED